MILCLELTAFKFRIISVYLIRNFRTYCLEPFRVNNYRISPNKYTKWIIPLQPVVYNKTQILLQTKRKHRHVLFYNINQNRTDWKINRKITRHATETVHAYWFEKQILLFVYTKMLKMFRIWRHIVSTIFRLDLSCKLYPEYIILRIRDVLAANMFVSEHILRIF